MKPTLPNDFARPAHIWRRAGVAVAVMLTSGAVAAMTTSPADADRIENQVAVFSALDKVTAHISKIEIPLNQTQTFGALKITPRACYSRPPTDEPKTTTFVEIDETQLDGSEKRIFTGWMFAESPGIYGLEHPTYDVWLNECKKPSRTIAEDNPNASTVAPSDNPAAADAGSAPAGAAVPADQIPPDQDFRRRVRR
ncbi:MAG: DUF2155 domain-containing protein [Hyphomicrobium sp.]|uniref:DUF2155 domain-containing protein n=1 Tax=Hyphomicrobium sp. TaxID=82 RepID=UPI0039E419E5